MFKTVLVVALLLGLTLVWLELRHRLRPASPLRLHPGSFEVDQSAERISVRGEITIANPHRRMEVFVPEITLKPTLLGRGDLSGLAISTRVIACHPDEETRADGYWAAYIVKGRKATRARLEVVISAPTGRSSGPADSHPADLRQLIDTLWLEVLWVNYGPFGRLEKRDGILVPLGSPEVLSPATANWQAGENCSVLPVRTHLLGVLDDPETVLRHYAGQILRSGDVLTIGETPLAVMQGRYHHPQTVQPSALARLLCRVFHPTSSLATACGLQTLIDVVGPARVLLAWLVGTALKLVGQKGWFYRLAGDQARLIDDVTGTTPPYDQTIVLGPEQPAAFCAHAAATLGVDVAVVDVNDLGRVKVLAANPGCDQELLQRALRPNPAGNANERTPLVVVRPGGGAATR